MRGQIQGKQTSPDEEGANSCAKTKFTSWLVERDLVMVIEGGSPGMHRAEVVIFVTCGDFY